MSEKDIATFFRQPISSKKIISLLMKNHSIKTTQKKEVSLNGTCDSRNGGHRKLVFSYEKNLKSFENLTDSFIIIDKTPEPDQQNNNIFCEAQDPKAAFIDLLQAIISEVGLDAHSYNFTQNASVSKNSEIASTAFIESGVEIGDGSIIGDGAVIKKGTYIGKNTVIGENTVLGSYGINLYKAKDGSLIKFPHVGGVYIGDNSEIGANCVVVGGILSPTTIGNNVIIGNLCNIGHSVIIGDSVWMSVGSLVGGHTTIQTEATIAMGVKIRDNVEIGSEASIGMGSVVVKGVNPRHSVFGNPAKRTTNIKAGPRR